MAWSRGPSSRRHLRHRGLSLCPAFVHTQRSEQEQFLFETTVEATVKDTVGALAEVHNLRAKIAVLKMEAEELAKYGPAKPLDKQGIDEYSEAPVDKGPHYTMDPTGRRTGNGEARSVCTPDPSLHVATVSRRIVWLWLGACAQRVTQRSPRSC